MSRLFKGLGQVYNAVAVSELCVRTNVSNNICLKDADRKASRLSGLRDDTGQTTGRDSFYSDSVPLHVNNCGWKKQEGALPLCSLPVSRPSTLLASSGGRNSGNYRTWEHNRRLILAITSGYQCCIHCLFVQIFANILPLFYSDCNSEFCSKIGCTVAADRHE